MAEDLPKLSASNLYYAWSNLGFGTSGDTAFYAQAFSEEIETKIANQSIYDYSWHPSADRLLYRQEESGVFVADAPYFKAQQIMTTTEKIKAVYWISP